MHPRRIVAGGWPHNFRRPRKNLEFQVFRGHIGNMRGKFNSKYRSLVFAVSALSVFMILAGCPLPYEFTGDGTSLNAERDPSSPTVTAAVSVGYTQAQGADGSVAHLASATTGSDTIITLSTETQNAVIYYTTDGSALGNLSGALQINASSGQIDLSIDDPQIGNDQRTISINAIAVGPNMRPSPETSVVVTVDYNVTPDPHLVTLNSLSLQGGEIRQAQLGAVLYGIELVNQGQESGLNSIAFQLTGSFDQFDIRRVRLWRSDDATFNRVSDTMLRGAFRGSGFALNDTVTFAFDSPLQLAVGTHYLFVTTNLDPIATVGNTVAVNVQGQQLTAMDESSVETITTALNAGPTFTFAPGDLDTAADSLVNFYDYRGRRFSYSDFTIVVPEITDPAGRVADNIPTGLPIEISFDFRSIQNRDECPACITQAYLGVRGVVNSCNSFSGYDEPDPDEPPLSRTLSFAATEPGLYFLTPDGSFLNGCEQELDPNGVEYFDAGHNLAVIRAVAGQ